MRVYVASSWRNTHQPTVVEVLRGAGHDVYDFRHPPGGDHLGFKWSAVDPDWRRWGPYTFRHALSHRIACAGFRADFEAMCASEAFVLVMPCGRSSHLELGWAAGYGKHTIVLLDGHSEPELMYKLADTIAVDLDEVLEALAAAEARKGEG